jgi:hypothetical protein
MNDTTRAMQPRVAYLKKSKENPYLIKSNEKNKPVKSSTKRYLKEMPLLQVEQRPRRIMKLIMGINSHALSLFPQKGQ